MIERMCPSCEASNEIEARRCHRCDEVLVIQPDEGRPAPLARLRPAELARGTGGALARLQRQLPAAVRQAARPVALGLAAVAVEVGAALLQRRLSQPGATQTALATRPAASGKQPPEPRRPRRTVVGQRVTEVYEQGQLRRRVVEQFISREEP